MIRRNFFAGLLAACFAPVVGRASAPTDPLILFLEPFQSPLEISRRVGLTDLRAQEAAQAMRAHWFVVYGAKE